MKRFLLSLLLLFGVGAFAQSVVLPGPGTPHSAGASLAFNSSCGNEDGTFDATVSCTLSVASGSTVAVGCGYNVATSWAVSDTSTNSYTSAGSVTTTGGAQLQVFYAKNVPSNASLTITCDPANGSGNRFIVAYDVTGVSTTSPLDVNGASATGNSQTPTSASFTTTASNEIIVPFVIEDSGLSITAGTGYTNLQTDGVPFSGAESEVVSSIQTGVTAGFTLGNITTWGVYVVSFK